MLATLVAGTEEAGAQALNAGVRLKPDPDSRLSQTACIVDDPMRKGPQRASAAGLAAARHAAARDASGDEGLLAAALLGDAVVGGLRLHQAVAGLVVEAGIA